LYTKLVEIDTEWIAKLVAYLQHAQVTALRDICASHEHPGIEEPTPATSHDLNYGMRLLFYPSILYPSAPLSPLFPLLCPKRLSHLTLGQQLAQMYEILYLYLTRTGNMQGIPRPRHGMQPPSFPYSSLLPNIAFL
jgi:hypothetical protein